MGAEADGRRIGRRAENSGVEVVGQGLVEVGDVVGLGGIEGGRLIEERDGWSLWGGPRAGERGRRLVGEVEVQEDYRDVPRAPFQVRPLRRLASVPEPIAGLAGGKGTKGWLTGRERRP
jgi:hypothetical protein